MDRIHVFLASDENYAQHSGVVLASLLANHDKGGCLSQFIISTAGFLRQIGITFAA